MGIRIIEGGAFTTVQDSGRYGAQSMGFSVSGVMDAKSAGMANMLLGKEAGAAVLEMALLGATVEFTESCLFALAGADMGPALNGQPIDLYHVYLGRRGDRLQLGYARCGVYCYLAFAGEPDLPKVMGSYSTNVKCSIGGYQGRRLVRGDVLTILESKETLPNLYKRYEKILPEFPKAVALRAIPGPEKHYFTEKGMDTFFSSTYLVSQEADRMGYRLEGTAVEAKGSVDVISNGIAFGAVQIPASGQPIVMMADRQTMGGYAKIANVISVDLPRLAQSRPGTEIRFVPVTVEQAQRLLRRERRAARRFYRAVN